MMKHLRRAFLFFTFLLSINSASAREIKCLAQHRILEDGVMIKGAYQFYLKGGEGVVKLEGVLKEDQALYNISREIRVSYRYTKGIFYLTNLGILNFPIESVKDEAIGKYLPAFFTIKNSELTIIPQKVGAKNYILTYSAVPIFICSALK